MNEQLRRLHTALVNKADSQPLNERTRCFSSELSALSTHCQLLSEQVLRLDHSALIADNEFKLALLEKKQQGFEAALTALGKERARRTPA